MDLRLSLTRGSTVLPWRCGPRPGESELSATEIAGAAAAFDGRPGAFLIGGGDPLQRGDLWEILRQLTRMRPDDLGLCCPGHGLTTALAERLRSAGVKRVHVPFHCARRDAHDWLFGQAGALKAAHRAICSCVEVGLPVAADIVLTRPTAAHLAETVEVLARLGVRHISVRRLMEKDTTGTEFVPLSPRLGLLEESLEQAAYVALERRVRLVLRDLPLCVAPRLRPLFAAPGSELWQLDDGSVGARSEAGVGCSACLGLPQCAGAPPDYVSRFGWEEFADPAPSEHRLAEDIEGQKVGRPSAPMVFQWRGPQRLRCAACADGADAAPSAHAPHESTRVIRSRLVQAARYRPSVLRLIGADLLGHPQAAPLLYDAVRLFPRVEVAGEASAMADWSDLDLRRLKDLQRIDVALYGPDAASHDAHCGIPGAFAAAMRGIERLRRHTRIAVGAFAILHDAEAVPEFAQAWERRQLPGAPRFRLSPQGGSLDELVEHARELPAGPARAALLAVLPRCLCEREGLAVEGDAVHSLPVKSDLPEQTIQFGTNLTYQPCGSDPIGAFAPCGEGAKSCVIPGCPGTAVGWRSTAGAKRWTVNI